MRSSAFTLRPAAFALALAASFVAFGSIAQAQAYRWVDKDGTVHYSDQPQPGAERVDLPKAQTYKAPPTAPVRVTRPAGTPGSGSGKVPGLSCEIVSPSPGQVFVNENAVTISYKGPDGYFAHVLLNDERREGEASGNAMRIAPISRGSYTAVVVFSNRSSGAEVCRTSGVSFHVRQPSVLSPARPRAGR